MRINLHICLLIALFTLGIVLRVGYLGVYPEGFFRDEAAIGYNSFSLLLTGKDEYGMQLPILVRSFEQFFLPLYVYLSIPLIHVLGLTILSTRALTAISGIVTLLSIYLIANRLWNKKIALFSLFALVISPWHIFYSRATFEGMLCLALFSLGFYALLLFLEKKETKHFFLSIILFVGSLYSYHTTRLFLPLFEVVTFALFYKTFLSERKRLVIPLIVGAVLVLPLLFMTFMPAGYVRGLGVSVFKTEKAPPGWIEGRESGLVTNNNIYLRSRQIGSLYISYFSPKNLFLNGEPDLQRSVVHYSTFYAWMMPFLFIGSLSFRRKLNSLKLLLLTWILISPVSAALTTDPFHVHRSILLYLPLTVLIGIGLNKVFDYLSPKFRISFLVALTAIGFLSLCGFLYSYVFLNSITPERLHRWDWSYPRIMEYINILPENTKVVVDDPWTQGYIHYLFQNKVPPAAYHGEVAKLRPVSEYYYTNPDVIRPMRIGNIEFRNVDWPSERGNSGTVFILTASELPESEFVNDPKVKLLKEITYPTGEVAFRIVEIE